MIFIYHARVFSVKRSFGFSLWKTSPHKARSLRSDTSKGTSLKKNNNKHVERIIDGGVFFLLHRATFNEFPRVVVVDFKERQ